MIDLTLTATRDGSDETDGMTFGELEDAVERGRAMGAKRSTTLRGAVNRNRRVRHLTVEIRPELDADAAPAPAAPPPPPEDPPGGDGGEGGDEVPEGHVPGQTALDEV